MKRIGTMVPRAAGLGMGTVLASATADLHRLLRGEPNVPAVSRAGSTLGACDMMRARSLPGIAILLFCIGGFAHQMLRGALITPLIGQSAGAWGYDPLFVALAGGDLPDLICRT